MEYKFVSNDEMRVLLSKAENQDTYPRIKYFFPKYMDECIHFLAFEADKIVGMLCLGNSYSHEKCYHLELVSVDQNFKNQGISKHLLLLAINFCKSSESALSYGMVSEEGQAYFMDSLNSMCKEHGVDLFSPHDELR